MDSGKTRRWRCSLNSGGIILLVFWLPFMPWCSAKIEDSLTPGQTSRNAYNSILGRTLDGDDTEDLPPPTNSTDNNFVPHNETNFEPKNMTNFESHNETLSEYQIEFLKWGRCYIDKGYYLRCCESNINTNEANVFYVCEEAAPSESGHYIHTTLETGNLREAVVSQYQREVRTIFNASENPAWRELVDTPLRDLSNVPLGHFFGLPARNLLSRAFTRSKSLATDRRKLEESLDGASEMLDSALNRTINNLIDETLDYVFSLESEDIDFITGHWFQLRERSLGSILDSFMNANSSDFAALESVFRFVWRLYANLQQENLDRFWSSPTNWTRRFVEANINPVFSNRSHFRLGRQRYLSRYIVDSDILQLSLPLCYSLPSLSVCLNIDFNIDTARWTLVKTVALKISSNDYPDANLFLQIMDLRIDGTGFRQRNQTGVCASGSLSILNLQKYPFPNFRLNCHPVFYDPMTYKNEKICLLLKKISPDATTLNRICTEPVQATLIRELIWHAIRAVINLNHLQPESNALCMNLVSPFVEQHFNSPVINTTVNGIMDLLVQGFANQLGYRPDHTTLRRVAHFVRTVPDSLDIFATLAQESKDGEQFTQNLLECGVLFLQQVQHRNQKTGHSESESLIRFFLPEGMKTRRRNIQTPELHERMTDLQSRASPLNRWFRGARERLRDLGFQDVSWNRVLRNGTENWWDWLVNVLRKFIPQFPGFEGIKPRFDRPLISKSFPWPLSDQPLLTVDIPWPWIDRPIINAQIHLPWFDPASPSKELNWPVKRPFVRMQLPIIYSGPIPPKILPKIIPILFPTTTTPKPRSITSHANVTITTKRDVTATTKKGVTATTKRGVTTLPPRRRTFN